MNDPGLDEPIQKTSNKVEGEHRADEDAEREDEQAFLNPRLNNIHHSSKVQWILMCSIVDGGLLLLRFHCLLYV